MAAHHPGVLKAARIATGFGAALELLICDFQRAYAASNFYDAETCALVRSGAMQPHQGRLETLAEVVLDRLNCDILIVKPQALTDELWGQAVE